MRKYDSRTAARLATMEELADVPRVVRCMDTGETFHTMHAAARQGAVDLSSANVVRKTLRRAWAQGLTEAEVYCARGLRWRLIPLRQRGAVAVTYAILLAFTATFVVGCVTAVDSAIREATAPAEITLVDALVTLVVLTKERKAAEGTP